jgi:hypothetical protein
MSLAKCLEQHAPPDRHDEIERAIKAQKLGQIKSIDNILAELRAEREDIVGQIRAAVGKKKTPAKIDDFGEKIGGARKDVYQALKDTMASVDKDSLVSLPLSKVWPEPDYLQMIEAGADKQAVSIVRAMRDSVPDKPRTSWKVKAWADKVSQLAKFAGEILDGQKIEAFVKEARKIPGSSLSDMMNIVDLYEAVGHEQSLKWLTFKKATWSESKGEGKWVEETKWVIERPKKATAMSNWPETLVNADTKEEAIEAFKESLSSLSLAPEKSLSDALKKFDIYQYRGDDKPGFFIGVKRGRTYIDLEKFDTAAEAKAYRKENADKLEAKLKVATSVPRERGEVNRDRIGQPHRDGDVTGEMFKETFGFRGGEFGNWVNNDERQWHLNNAYDALYDLSLVLGIQQKALSLNGELAIAFGARGKGGKDAPSAHYEADKIVINLTKRSGPGSLAHEWFHAVDNYFSRSRGRGADFISEHAYIRIGEDDKTRKELVDAFDGIHKAIVKTDLIKRSKELDNIKNKKYWATGLEYTARSFENYVVEKLQGYDVTNDYLANISNISAYSEAMIEGMAAGKQATDVYPYLLKEELPGVVKAFDKLFETIKTEETDKGVRLYSKAVSSNLQENGANKVDTEPSKNVESEYDDIYELKSYGMVEDEGRTGLGRQIAETLGTDRRIRVWKMPSYLVERDNNGRLILTGNPRTNYELAERIARVLGREIVWATIDDNKLEYNGVYLHRDNILIIDPRSRVSAAAVLGHELSHHLESQHSEIYQELIDNLEPLLINREKYKERFDFSGKTELFVTKEIVADLMGDSFTEPRFWDEVAVQVGGSKFRKLATAVMRWIQSVMKNLTRYAGFESEKFTNDLRRTRLHLARAIGKYSNEIGRPSPPKITTGFQYSVAETITPEEIGVIVEQFKDKADISPVTSIFVTAEYTSAKDASFKRAFEAAMKRGEEKVALGYYILDGVTRDDGPAAFNEKKDSLIKTFDGLNDSQSKEVEYIRETDKTGKAFRIKYVDGFTVKTPDGVYVGTAKTKESADTLIRDHHKANNMQGKVLMEDYQTTTGMWQVWSNQNKLIKEFDNEADAVTATMEAEGKFLVKEGFSPEAINAILSFRAAMNRAFDLQVREWRKIVEMCKEKGWDIPTTEAIDEDKRWAVKDKSGKTIATYAEKSEAELFSESMGRTNKVVRQADSDIRKTITLEDAIARMGDLRGSYFPRQRRSGAVTMVAVNEQTGEKILEEFDLYLLKGVKPEHETGITNAKELLRSAANYGTPMARRMRELKRKGFTVSTKMTEKTPEQVFETAQLAASISALLNESIDKSKKSGDSKAERQAFEAIHQAVVLQVADLFKQRGALSSRMKRSEEYWEGFETDPLKAAVQYAKSMAGGIAKRQAAQEMTLAITGRDITWKQWKEDNPKGEYGDYMKFVKDRALDPVKQPNLYKEYFSWSKEVLRNDEQADRIIGTLRGLATLKYLGLRPAAAVVNLTNFLQAVPATISTDTGRSIKSALAQVNRSLAARHAYNKGRAGDLDANIFAGIVERGWDQAQYSHEAAGVLRSKAGNVGAWISDKMMAMFAWSERVNRATTIHAAYLELMRSKGIEKPNAEQHEELMVGAREISDRAHGIYGKETAPVWTRGQFNPLRMTWTFAKFSQNYMLNMGRMVGKGDYKNAAWMLLSPGVLGGAGASLATPVIIGLMKAFGIGGDDPEEELYKWVESQLGSDSLARHGLPGLVGVNFKGPLAANIPFPTTLSEIFGAPGSVVTDVKEAAVHAGRGEFLKAGEKLLPSAFSAPIKAYRESTEGITTGTYSPVYHGKEQLKADPWDAFLRASSFNPSRLSGIREKQWKEKTRAKSYLEERTEINSMVKKAWINGGYRLSRADLARMKVYIDDYNDRVKNLKLPGVSPITDKSIKLLLKRNAKASKFEAERE